MQLSLGSAAETCLRKGIVRGTDQVKKYKDRRV